MKYRIRCYWIPFNESSMDARLCGEIAHSLQKKNRTEITSSIRLCFDTFFSRIISISIIVVVVLYTNHINILFSISFHLNLFYFFVCAVHWFTMLFDLLKNSFCFSFSFVDVTSFLFFSYCRCYFERKIDPEGKKCS